MCARTEKNVGTVSPESRTSRRPTGLSVIYHGRWVFIGRLCPRLFAKTCIWNVWWGAEHRSWQMRTVLLAWSMLSFCFRSSRSTPLTFFLYGRKGVLGRFARQSAEQSQCQNFCRRSLAFSSMRALHGLQLPGHLSTVPVSRNFLNSFLTPRFVQLFSGNSSVNLFAVYPFKYKIFIKNLALVTNTAVMSAVTNFWCQTNWSQNSINKTMMTWKILFAISTEKDSLF